ncbi:EAL domain-containing protein [Winslowiella toletana]|uniref:EAL domain-containing protein n=1 Tax=Winslowiella toletana TaxID=92490 RepID=UPI0028BD27A5|nr:EAL domain-containing protein [Winslowiella toletana]WNN43797.1 EAL domain-containing protein [Winslowiella toletana]
MNENNDNYQFILEPIRDFSGSLIAYELLTKFVSSNRSFYCKQDKENGFLQISQSERLSIFNQQLALLDNIYQKNNTLPKISVHIDKVIANEITNNFRLQQLIAQMPLLRFEICNFFSRDADNDESLLLRELTKVCPLWLDDFGAGNTNLTMVMKGKFEYVKIEKNFFWQYGKSNAFRDLISHLNAFCDVIIVEGIQHARHEEQLRALDVKGMQGYHWKPVKADAVVKLLH